MAKLRFTIKHRDKNSKARTGIILTEHGTIKTPAFVPVGSGASIKSLTPEEIKEAKIDVFFVNTYHMLFRPGIETVFSSGGLHKFMNWDRPLMTDSGGFQVFSLSEHGPRLPTSDKPMVKISELGIKFRSVWDGSELFLGPNESMDAQLHLGADLIMAFDECTFYPITKKQARSAMERTHRWAKVCIEKIQKSGNENQNLFGIVQGSVFEDLRRESAKFMADLSFEGLAIGSVANSKEPREKVFAVLDWTLPYLLPTEKPVHFLGIGEIEDIFLSVEHGIDSLDCVTPTRLGRMGWIFDKKTGLKNKFRYDISKSNYSREQKPPVEKCPCYTCQNFSRSYMHHLFRNRELLAYRLATIHNLYFFGTLMEEIRQAITDNEFIKLKKDWLGN